MKLRDLLLVAVIGVGGSGATIAQSYNVDWGLNPRQPACQVLDGGAVMIKNYDTGYEYKVRIVTAVAVNPAGEPDTCNCGGPPSCQVSFNGDVLIVGAGACTGIGEEYPEHGPPPTGCDSGCAACDGSNWTDNCTPPNFCTIFQSTTRAEIIAHRCTGTPPCKWFNLSTPVDLGSANWSYDLCNGCSSGTCPSDCREL